MLMGRRCRRESKDKNNDGLREEDQAGCGELRRQWRWFWGRRTGRAGDYANRNGTQQGKIWDETRRRKLEEDLGNSPCMFHAANKINLTIDIKRTGPDHRSPRVITKENTSGKKWELTPRSVSCVVRASLGDADDDDAIRC